MEKLIRQCNWCQAEFETEWETKLYCSRYHKERAAQRRQNKARIKKKTVYLRQCKGCEQTFTTTSNKKLYCSTECQKWFRTQHRTERDKEYINAKTPSFKRRIYFASEGICGICKEPIDLRNKYPNPKSFSIDHIIPRAAGGSHSFSNLQAAHLDCNARRGNKPL
jgi:hypothetical protein